MSQNRHRQNPIDIAAAAVVLALAAALSLFAVRNNDVWWLMAVGRRIVETKAFITHDPFSFTMAGAAWSPQAWLSGIVLYAAHDLAGAAGLVLLRCVLVTAAVGLTLRAVHRAGVTLLAAAPLMVLLLLVAHTRFVVRGHLFEYVFIAFLLGFLLTSHSRRDRVFFSVGVALQVLWVNTHPSFPLGPALVGLFFLGEYASQKMAPGVVGCGPIHRHDYRRALILVGLMLVACVVNPNPAALLTQPFDTGQRELMSRFTLEWKSPFDPAMAGAGFHPYYEILLAVAVLAILTSLKRLTLAPILLIVATALMSFQSHRFRVEFALVAVPMSCLLLARSPLVTELVGRVRRAGRWMLPCACAAATAVLAVRALGLVEVSFSRLERYPDRALEFVVENDLAHRSYHSIGYGSYLIWSLGGRRQSFIDGRNPSVSVYRDFLTAQTDERGTGLIAEKHQLDAFILPALELSDAGMITVHQALADDSLWVPVYIDEQTMVYSSREHAPADWLLKNAYNVYHPMIGRRALDEVTLDRLIAELVRATDVAPEYGRLWVDLASARLTRGDREGAISAVRSALTRVSDDPPTLDRIAGIAAQAGAVDDAVAIYEQLARRSPGDAIAWYRLARVCDEAGRDRQAVQAYEAAIELDPTFLDAWQGEFRLHFRSGSFTRALPLAQRLTEAMPASHVGYYLQAEVARRLGRTAQGIELARDALKREPDAPGVHMLLAVLYADAEEYELALRHLDRVLAIAPDDEGALGFKAQIEEYLGVR